MEAEASSGMGLSFATVRCLRRTTEGKEGGSRDAGALRRGIKLRVDEKGASESLSWQK